LKFQLDPPPSHIDLRQSPNAQKKKEKTVGITEPPSGHKRQKSGSMKAAKGENHVEGDPTELRRVGKILEESVQSTGAGVELISESERIEQLATLKSNICTILFIVSCVIILLVIALSINTQLDILATNAAGLLFLIAFSMVLVVQYFAMMFHRLSTLLTIVAFIPLHHVNCAIVDRGPDARKPVWPEVGKKKNVGMQGFKRDLGIPERKVSMLKINTRYKRTMSDATTPRRVAQVRY